MAAAAARDATADDRPRWHDAVVGYLEGLARPDGGYAWEDQEASHLTPTYAVVGCYHLLGRTPPASARLAAFIRDHHPATGSPPWEATRSCSSASLSCPRQA